MMYKVVYSNHVIDILETPQYVRWLKRGKKFVKTEQTSAHGVRASDDLNIYHVEGMPDFDGMDKYKTVELVSIDKEEYDYLRSLIIKGRSLETDLRTARETKITEMSIASEKAIHAGTDITLSDNNSYHFSFTDQDQAGINYLATKANTAKMLEIMKIPTNDTGKDYPWHADGGDVVFYSRRDILTIGIAMRNHITYHNAYFHALRNYIEDMTNVLKIMEISYGIDIPGKYWGEVYASMAERG